MHNTTSSQKINGFTIVEVLIVIVVIAIIAAITVVSYGKIIARTNTTNAKSAANLAIKKMEAYAATTDRISSESEYPTTPSILTTADSTKTYKLSDVTFTETLGENGVKPASPNVLNFYNCPNGAGVSYYDYESNTWVQIFTGGAIDYTCSYEPDVPLGEVGMRQTPLIALQAYRAESMAV